MHSCRGSVDAPLWQLPVVLLKVSIETRETLRLHLHTIYQFLMRSSRPHCYILVHRKVAAVSLEEVDTVFRSEIASCRDSFMSSTIWQCQGVAAHSEKRLPMSRLCRLATRSMKKTAIFFLAYCGGVSIAHAQSTFGSILGTVTDVTGAIVVDATITAQSVDDNVERKTNSTVSGEFILENLKPGHYKITAHHDGFRDVVAPSVVLDARQELRLPFVLSVAVATTAVEVNAGAEQVNTENATISDTVLNEDVTQLPMNSRAVSSSPLANLAVSPSVVTDSQGNISVGGATAAQTGFSVDGISTANVRANGAFTMPIRLRKESRKPR